MTQISIAIQAYCSEIFGDECNYAGVENASRTLESVEEGGSACMSLRGVPNGTPCGTPRRAPSLPAVIQAQMKQQSALNECNDCRILCTQGTLISSPNCSRLKASFELSEASGTDQNTGLGPGGLDTQYYYWFTLTSFRTPPPSARKKKLPLKHHANPEHCRGH